MHKERRRKIEGDTRLVFSSPRVLAYVIPSPNPCLELVCSGTVDPNKREDEGYVPSSDPWQLCIPSM